MWSDGAAAHRAQPGRYHLYLRAACPASQRLLILRDLLGLRAAVSASFVHGLRDARGWAFRAETGPDPVNGFVLLRDAYLASDPGWQGEAAVPALWDRVEQRIVSNDGTAIGVGLITAFRRHGGGSVAEQLYPAEHAADIERFELWIREHLGSAVTRAVYRRPDAVRVRRAMRGLDAVFATRHRVLGDQLTDADIRLWVRLVRYDAGPNAHGPIGPRLDAYPSLWRWARELYAFRTFRQTTDFAAFTAPLADLPPWSASMHPVPRLTSPIG